MRAMWNGSISFGLINIPVKLFSGSESRGGINLTMLHKEDLSPIRYAKFCKNENKEVQMSDIVKGYEVGDGDYVVITEEDFEKANVERTKTIDISQFANESEIDVRYFEKPYALLREALQRSNRIAIAKFVIRNREHLAAIKPVGRALILNQMRFPSELRQPDQLNLPDAESVNKDEIEMALKLVDQLTDPFIAEDYHDTYTEELENIIQEKISGHKPTRRSKAPSPTSSKDLMAMLKKSLESEKSKAKVE